MTNISGFNFRPINVEQHSRKNRSDPKIRKKSHVAGPSDNVWKKIKDIMLKGNKYNFKFVEKSSAHIDVRDDFGK